MSANKIASILVFFLGYFLVILSSGFKVDLNWHSVIFILGVSIVALSGYIDGRSRE